MKQFFINIDIFGYIPSLSIQKQLHYHTFFGGILTVILILISIITIIFFSQELFNKKSPSVNLSTESLMNAPKLNYFDNFEFLIGIQNSSYITEINEKIFNAKGTLFKTIINETGTFNLKTDINLTSCNIALSKSENKELYSSLNLKGYYCISNIQKNEIYLNEIWGHNNFTMIQFKFIDCDNKTGNCANKEEINNYLNSADLSFYIINNLVSTKNYKNPFTKNLKESSLKISHNYKVSITQYLKHTRVESDDGILLTSNHYKDSFSLGDFKHDIILERDSTTFLSLSIQLDNTFQKYQRKYYKLQDLAAQVGGIVNTCFVISTLILKLYEKNCFFEYLINHFFEVRLDEVQKTIKLKNYRKNLHDKKNNISDNIKNPINNNVTINTNNNTGISNSYSNNNINIENEFNNNIINDKNHKIEFSFFDKLILLKVAPKFSNAKKQKIDEIYIKGIDYIMNNIDVISFLKRNHIGEMESKLLMSNDQKKIFEYISKPILSLSFIGSRYNLHNLPIKYKKELLGRNSIIQQIQEEYYSINNPEEFNQNNKQIISNKKNNLDDINFSD